MTSNYAIGLPEPIRARSLATTRRPFGLVRIGLVAVFALALNLLAGGLVAAQDASSTPTVTPVPDAPRIEIEFRELNDSGVTGKAILSEAGDQTIVELDLEDTGTNHPAHIHEGTCDDIQPVSAYDLENVGEEGTSTSLVDAPLQDLIDGDYVIDLHLAPNQLGTLIVCADIEGTPKVPSVGGEGTAVATEGATETATEEATLQIAATEQATEAATEAATEEPTETPTEAATEEPTTTPEPTEVPTEEVADGTGGPEAPITTDGTSADSGKGLPLTPTPAPTQVPVGGVSDGTQGGNQSQSGKGVPVSSTTSQPAGTGSGSSLIFAESPAGVAMWSMGIFSLILAAAGTCIRRGELRQAQAPSAGRWRRLGL